MNINIAEDTGHWPDAGRRGDRDYFPILSPSRWFCDRIPKQFLYFSVFFLFFGPLNKFPFCLHSLLATVRSDIIKTPSLIFPTYCSDLTPVWTFLVAIFHEFQLLTDFLNVICNFLSQHFSPHLRECVRHFWFIYLRSSRCVQFRLR